MIAQTDAGGQPGAVVVHLEDAALAAGAVVSAIGFLGLALFAEAHLAVGFYGEGSGGGGRVGRQLGVAVAVGGAAGVGEDGRSVGPVEEGVDEEGAGGGRVAWGTRSAEGRRARIEEERTQPCGLVGLGRADADVDPDGPGGQAVDEGEREVGGKGAAAPLCPPRPAAHIDVEGGRRGSVTTRVHQWG